MKRRILFGIGVVSLLLFQSCALTNSIKTINYVPNVKVENKLSGTKSLSLEELKDGRGYDNPKIIFYKKNLYNQQMAGAYTVEKPLAEIVRQGLLKGLEDKGVTLINTQSNFTLKGTIQKVDYEVISGFFSGDIITNIVVKFELVNNETKKIEWMDIITGKDKVRGAHFDKFISLSIDNLSKQLIENQSFIEALKN